MYCRYETYDELYDYCYRVAGTVALMSVPVMGVDKSYKVRPCCFGALCLVPLPDLTRCRCWRACAECPACTLPPTHSPTPGPLPTSPQQGPLDAVYRSALALGTANQLTNILRDVGEDAGQRNRIYVPLEELAAFKIKEEEVGWSG